MLYTRDIEKILNRQGFHVETDVGYYNSNRRMGPDERMEEYRAEMIEARIAERQRYERRNFKGYE